VNTIRKFNKLLLGVVYTFQIVVINTDMSLGFQRMTVVYTFQIGVINT